MSENFEKVLTAVQTVDEESRKWKSNDGETLDLLAKRRLQMAAERLTRILFPTAREQIVAALNLLPEVTWDRWAGKIGRQDNRSDFVVVKFDDGLCWSVSRRRRNIPKNFQSGCSKRRRWP